MKNKTQLARIVQEVRVTRVIPKYIKTLITKNYQKDTLETSYPSKLNYLA